MEARVARHRDGAGALVEGLEALGFEPLVARAAPPADAQRLRLPARGAGEAALRRRLLDGTASRSAAGSASSRAGSGASG